MTSVSVCLSICVCLSAITAAAAIATAIRLITTTICVRNYTSDLYQIFLPVTGRGSVFLWRRSHQCCVLSGVRMTSCLLVSQGCSTSPPSWSACTRSLGLGCKLRAVVPVAGQRTQGATFRALKVTSQVATPGAESAVCDWPLFVNAEAPVSLADLIASICTFRWKSICTAEVVWEIKGVPSAEPPAACIVHTLCMSQW